MSKTRKEACARFDGEVVKGTVFFNRSEDANAPVEVTGEITGLDQGFYALHIHEFGDDTNGCISASADFNLSQSQDYDEALSDSVRNFIDLGFVEAGGNGVTKINISDGRRLISFEGEHNIIGCVLVVHHDPDNLSESVTVHDFSKTTGNAGARLACGVIFDFTKP